jgi:hypothetical protein
MSALNIALPTSGGTAAGVKVTSCTLTKASDSTDGSPIVTINANGGALNDVTLLDCTVFNMATAPAGQYGLAIATGSNIKILGGTYTSNGPSGGAGIAITGAATEVQIIGVNLQPSSAVPSSPNAQQYALLISGNPAGVLVSSCDMTGYGSASPVRITGFPARLRITGCPGYNNSNTNLTASPTQLITGVNAASSTTPYYGPSVFMYSNPTTLTLHVFGQSIVASTGIFFLPSAYDTFFFNSAPASFTWIGQ